MLLHILLLCLVLTIEPGHVKRTVDGDTFSLYHVGVVNEERVRVLGGDAPERGQPGFAIATATMDSLVRAGPFELAACGRDSFGRLLGVAKRGTVVFMDVLIARGLAVRR